LPHVTNNATCHIKDLTRDIFLKFKKIQKTRGRGKVLNGVCENLTEGTTFMHITNLGTKLRQT